MLFASVLSRKSNNLIVGCRVRCFFFGGGDGRVARQNKTYCKGVAEENLSCKQVKEIHTKQSKTI